MANLFPAQQSHPPGYTFTGWYLDKTCTIPYRFDTAVTSNLTLYAGWKRNTTEHKPITPVDPIQPVEPEVPTFTDVKPTTGIAKQWPIP